MSNKKNCGECKYYDMHGGCNKIPNTLWIHSTNIACIEFASKNPTNGEKIWQSGYDAVITFAKTWMQKFSCWADAEAWLNAPADCVAENGESAKQTDLCRKVEAESEGKNETE